jgi:hypothetical protein
MPVKQHLAARGHCASLRESASVASGARAGTYVAEAWPEDRRKMGAGYLQTGYYFGFFVAAALNVRS